MTDKSNQQSPDQAVATEEVADARRDFLKKLGKYASVTSVGTAILLTSNISTANSSCRSKNPNQYSCSCYGTGPNACRSDDADNVPSKCQGNCNN